MSANCVCMCVWYVWRMTIDQWPIEIWSQCYFISLSFFLHKMRNHKSSERVWTELVGGVGAQAGRLTRGRTRFDTFAKHIATSVIVTIIASANSENDIINGQQLRQAPQDSKIDMSDGISIGQNARTGHFCGRANIHEPTQSESTRSSMFSCSKIIYAF